MTLNLSSGCEALEVNFKGHRLFTSDIYVSLFIRNAARCYFVFDIINLLFLLSGETTFYRKKFKGNKETEKFTETIELN